MGDDKEALSGTKQVALTKLEKDAHLREKEIDADTHLKDKALDLEAEKLRLEGKKIDKAADDEKRNDRRELVRTILLWSIVILFVLASCVIVGLCLWFGQTVWLTVFVGTVLGLGLIGLAIWYGRSIDFAGFGFTAKTGDKAKEIAAKEALSPPPPPDPPDSPPASS